MQKGLLPPIHPRISPEDLPILPTDSAIEPKFDSLESCETVVAHLMNTTLVYHVKSGWCFVSPCLSSSCGQCQPERQFGYVRSVAVPCNQRSIALSISWKWM